MSEDMSRFIQRDCPISITPEPAELADVWWSLTAGEQIVFFNRLAEISKNMLSFQLQSVTDGEDGAELTADARHVLRLCAYLALRALNDSNR